ncbi:Sporulation protein YlmC, PRC-barrel domain family [Loktanella atrilutea]|uniref:Sporulation protein YlmC, PRC-barrel domain family n=1 Tax=Loktanella atrilutea TaxID=366533 RepID=A0A1M4WVZ4_LOKAT|nr:PRC-barrel domain-containing protein [Loktanella atrilutea]SHE85327.1 Sporulation protein YlmC, PRC-barrel domain family [Loktanella atrilutea]
MTRQFPRLLLTTALCLPIATASFAQSDAACEDLGVALNDGLPENLSGDVQRITDVQAAGDPAACDVELVAIKSVTEGSDQASDEETLAETDQLTVKLQDEMTVQGMVYLDRQPANVDIAGGDTEVSVTSEQPDVTVTEGQANIVIRQAAANVVVEMPQPTIRIEQPAPEVIITMPAPGVDVANARPQVEVRQAKPTVTVTQAAPKVDLELERVPEGETASTTVTDRASGSTYAAGEAGESMAMDDATVNMPEVEPKVVYQDGEAKTPTVNRAEPTVSFESAQPNVQVTSMGEPQIEMVQTGDPVVTIEQSADASDSTPAAAADSTAPEADADAPESDAAAAEGTEATDAAAESQTEDQAAADTPPADVAPISQDGAAAMDSAEGETATEAGDAADADAATDTAAADTATAPVVTRDGYTAVPLADLRADTLQGMKVYGVNDEDVGDVGTVIETAEGAVQGLVVEVGGFLGLGERKIEVPVEMVSVLSDGNGEMRVYVDATEDRLKDMPEYEG